MMGQRIENIVDLCYNEENKVVCIDQQGKIRD
jgi:hypothetical protein